VCVDMPEQLDFGYQVIRLSSMICLGNKESPLAGAVF